MRWALGIDLGGTRIKAVALDSDGNVLDEGSALTEDEASGAWTQRILESVASLEKRLGATAASIGLAAPGFVAADHRSVEWMQGRLQGLQGLDWATALNRSAPVPVLNDAHAALLGETWKGAAKGQRDVVMLTLGTGVGGAIMCDGNLLRGAIGRAGHIGHICLDTQGELDIVRTPGSLEDQIGECTLARRSGGRFQCTQDLVNAHLRGDEEASRVWLTSVRALACGIVSLINAVDPKVVVIGGGIANADAALWKPLEQMLDELEWRPSGHRVEIVKAQLGELAGAYGAAQFGITYKG